MSMTIDDSLVSETVGVNAGREEKQQEQPRETVLVLQRRYM